MRFGVVGLSFLEAAAHAFMPCYGGKICGGHHSCADGGVGCSLRAPLLLITNHLECDGA